MTPGPLRAVELVRVQMPLVVPFTTATSTTAVKDALLVRVVTDDGEGWGECGAQTTADYSPETIDVAHATLRDELVPRALAGRSIDDVPGAHFAKAALSSALLDAELRARGVSLASHLGGQRARVMAGVAIGITDDVVTAAQAYVAAGYRRLKLKIAPGIPLQQVHAVRAAVGPDVALQADANESYALADSALLATLDEARLQCLEQPLPRDALADHAELARRIATPICLDESLPSEGAVRDAVALGACQVVNVKPGRLGGIEQARRVHDVCAAAGVPVLCGGMLETGVGRAVNVALASLPGFTIPGDLSASDRYFAEDLTEPFELDDGYLHVPSGPGIGVTIRVDVLARYAVARERL
jgi:O-succinylbenzoate synthase